MCPFCLSSAALLIAGTVSSGAAALVATTKLAGKFRKEIGATAQRGRAEVKNSVAVNATAAKQVSKSI